MCHRTQSSLPYAHPALPAGNCAKAPIHTIASYICCSTFPGRGQGSVQKKKPIVGQRFGVKEIFTTLLGTLVIALVSWQWLVIILEILCDLQLSPFPKNSYYYEISGIINKLYYLPIKLSLSPCLVFSDILFSMLSLILVQAVKMFIVFQY